MFYFPTWMVSERLANGELTLSVCKQWAHAEQIWQVFMNGECLVNKERKQSANAIYDMCTPCEGKMNDLLGVSQKVSLHCVSSVIRKK